MVTLRSRRNKRLNNFIKFLPLTVMALPALIVVFLFNYLPYFGLILPFKNYKISQGFFGSEWAGLENFKYLFYGEDIANATFNTIFYNLVFIFVGAFCALVLALLLYEVSSKAVKTYQTILLLPYFISWVVVAYILNTLLDVKNGVLNRLLAVFGVEEVMWYSEPKYWRFILPLVNIWKGIGYGAILYYASLMGISPEYYEAARIDGAGKLKQIWYISIPALKSIIIMQIILGIGKVFHSDFGLFYNVTQNSTLLYETTDVIDTFVYRSLMNLGDIGMSSAAAFYQSVAGFILVIITNYLVNKIDQDNALF